MAADPDRPLSHRDVLGVSVPIIVSNVTTPLVGLVDAAAIGQLGDPTLMAGVTLGASLLTLLFWTFGFLRMGTGGFAAQAFGAGDRIELTAILQRAVLIAISLGAMLVILELLFGTTWLAWMGGSPAATAEARTYFGIRLWSAPVTFVNYALIGWFIGQAQARTVLMLQLLQNIVNMALAFLFVLGFGWGVAGSAWAAVLAEVTAVAAAAIIAFRQITRTGGMAPWAAVLERSKLVRTVAVNRDIMIRTLCVEIAFLVFVARAATQGDVALAANAMLFHLFKVMAFFLDGFAFAAETFVGQAIGARRRDRFVRAAWLTGCWAAALAIIAGVTCFAAGPLIIDLTTTSMAVRAEAKHTLVWVALTPVLGFAAFQLDGIFIGATRGADMRNMMLLSLVFYFVAAYGLTLPQLGLGLNGLWIALLLFFVVRALTLTARLSALMRDAFGSTPSA